MSFTVQRTTGRKLKKKKNGNCVQNREGSDGYYAQNNITSAMPHESVFGNL